MKSVQILFSIVIVLVLSAVAAGLYGVAMNSRTPTVSPSVTDFASCANAGYPVMESYPRQCASPDGRSFIEEVQIMDDSTFLVATSTATSSVPLPTNIELQ